MKSARQLIGDLLGFLSGKNQSFPEKSAYDNNDHTVNSFFETVNACGDHNNVKIALKKMDTESPESVDSIIEKLEKSVEAEAYANLRYSYHNLIKALSSESYPVILEDLHSGIEDLTPAEHRVEAARGLKKFAQLNPDDAILTNDLEDLILEGSHESLKFASSMIKTAFTSHVPQKNIKVAYTSLSTQNGEPYQMCPKAQKVVGYAIPMEISKCRDNCIDSRKTRDGHVTCAYQDWLRVVADNQESVMARLENQRITKNEGKTLNVITRPGPADDESPREKIFEDSKELKEQNKYYKREDLLEQSIESSLEERKLNNKQSSSEGRITTASTVNKYTEDSGMKKFNLSQHIKATSINDKLDEYRSFFKDTFVSESPSEMTNKSFDNKKYESNSTSMEELVGERRTGNPDSTLNEQLESKRSKSNPQAERTLNESVDARRKNESLETFMKTLEERLGERRTNK
jgi:hypothetical protein